MRNDPHTVRSRRRIVIIRRSVCKRAGNEKLNANTLPYIGLAISRRGSLHVKSVMTITEACGDKGGVFLPCFLLVALSNIKDTNYTR